MTKGKPVKALLKFSVPLFAGNIMQNLYNVFDTAVVGHVLGKNALAAVGNSYVPMLVINSIILGLSSGILILLAQVYGSGEKVQGCMGSIRTLVFLTGGGLACIFFLSAGWIFRAMGIPAAAARPAAEYLRITALGIPFLSAYNFYSAVAKAGGDARTPVRDMSVSCLMNIVLDYVFVVILRLGIRGASSATVISQAAAAGLSVAELIPALYGNITQGTSTLGSAGTRVPGSAGETTEALEDSYGIRSLIMADGPAGLRLRQSYEADRETGSVYGVGVLGSLENGFLEKAGHHENTDTCYQYCTAFPVGTAMAQSWDLELMQKFGEAVAAEMEEFGVDLWLAPGMNIQRNPLCGRNFEYYSEDPLLSGMMAASVTKGVQSHHGRGVTLKHFACNNQEDNRMGVNVRVAQRALREIYLRGFEIAVKKSRPVAMMSAYNRINGVHAANSLDLCTTAARGEWGFEGIIMSDWNTTVPEDGSVPWQCIAAGNDIIMPGNQKDDEEIRRAYEQGELTEEMIRRSAGRLFAAVRRLTDKI